jgi:hypothetical protein
VPGSGTHHHLPDGAPAVAAWDGYAGLRNRRLLRIRKEKRNRRTEDLRTKSAVPQQTRNGSAVAEEMERTSATRR